MAYWLSLFFMKFIVPIRVKKSDTGDSNTELSIKICLMSLKTGIKTAEFASSKSDEINTPT